MNNNKGRSGGRNQGDRNRGGFRKNSFNGSPREMHKTTCAECKQQCEVPFKPTEGRPVYCKDCYSKHR